VKYLRKDGNSCHTVTCRLTMHFTTLRANPVTRNAYSHRIHTTVGLSVNFRRSRCYFFLDRRRRGFFPHTTRDYYNMNSTWTHFENSLAQVTTKWFLSLIICKKTIANFCLFPLTPSGPDNVISCEYVQ